MSEYTPTTDEVLRCYRQPMSAEQAQREGETFADFLSRRSIETFQQQIADREAAQRWLAEVERAAAEKGYERAWAEVRSIPHWWNSDEQRGGFDIPPTGLGPALEDGAFMEVRRVLLDNPYRLNEGAKQ